MIESLTWIILALFFAYIEVPYFIMLASAAMPMKIYKTTGKLPSVSIIIPTKNEGKLLEKTLKKIMEMDWPKNKRETIVIDAKSTDKTKKIAKKYGCKFLTDDGKGKPAALNKAVKKARYNLLYILDADSKPKKSALKKLVEAMNEKYVSASGINTSSDSKKLVAKVCRLELILHNITLLAIMKIIGTGFIVGRNFIIKKKDLLEVSGFDEKLTEDINLTRKLHDRKKLIVYVPEAVCIEEPPSGFSSFLNQHKRWIAGGLHELKPVIYRHRLTDIFFYIPMSITVGLLPIWLLILPISSIALFFSGMPWHIFIIPFTGFALVSAALFIMAIKRLNIKDLMLFPITLLLMSTLTLYTVLKVLMCFSKKEKIEWYKTEK